VTAFIEGDLLVCGWAVLRIRRGEYAGKGGAKNPELRTKNLVGAMVGRLIYDSFVEECGGTRP
jgi:hypothetical protein